jgi:nucleotide-binding universal stress UspA family protein
MGAMPPPRRVPGVDDNLVVGVDGRAQGEDALALGRLLARVLVLTPVLAHVVPPALLAQGGLAYDAILRREGNELLERAAAKLGGAAIERHLLDGPSAAGALQNLAERLDAKLLVVGSAHRGRAGRVLLGSVAHGLITGAPCPVALAPLGYRDRTPAALNAIGVAYDGGAEADLALDFALALAQPSGAALRLWLAIAPTGLESAHPERYAEFTEYMHGWASGQLERGLQRAGDGARAEVLEGDPAEAIRDAAGAEGVDLVVCGSRGYGPVRRVLAGSTSRRLLDGARQPVIVVPRAG